MADVTFGRTTAGATVSGGGGTDYVYGNTYTSGSNPGTLVKLTAYLQGYAAGQRCKAAIYSGTTLLGVSTNELSGFGAKGWYDFTFSGETIAASTDYTLVMFLENAGWVFYKDNTAGSALYQAIVYGDFPNPATFTGLSRYYSIYATYTESVGGGISIPVVMHHLRQQGIS